MRNGTNALTDGANVSGSTNRTLTLRNVGYTDAATYSVVISNKYDRVTNSAILSVLDASALTDQTDHYPGDTVTFTNTAWVTANVPSPWTNVFTWWKDGNELTNNGHCVLTSGPVVTNGAFYYQNSTLSILNAIANDSSTHYSAVVTLNGASVSHNATLTVWTNVSSLAPPADLIIRAGQTASFTNVASGTGPFYFGKRVSPANLQSVAKEFQIVGTRFLNWRRQRINGRNLLTLVELYERGEAAPKSPIRIHWRHARLLLVTSPVPAQFHLRPSHRPQHLSGQPLSLLFIRFPQLLAMMLFALLLPNHFQQFRIHGKGPSIGERFAATRALRARRQPAPLKYCVRSLRGCANPVTWQPHAGFPISPSSDSWEWANHRWAGRLPTNCISPIWTPMT